MSPRGGGTGPPGEGSPWRPGGEYLFVAVDDVLHPSGWRTERQREEVTEVRVQADSSEPLSLLKEEQDDSTFDLFLGLESEYSSFPGFESARDSRERSLNPHNETKLIESHNESTVRAVGIPTPNKH
ncbi:hypothetical protein ANANG_G00082470 [Anguilla anguilla]|uniref:Uncharacterized protein n=1 Tax=Anguilla anguilla TaxID=7936 RepID=A0A9D3MK88_ANGAN|nr:hypothetical protein ANANG_G00082470 [Anguilla anguilla]